MTTLLTKMESELNAIHRKRSAILMADAPLITEYERQKLIALTEAQKKLRKMIDDYIKIQNQFLELTGQLSINY